MWFLVCFKLLLNVASTYALWKKFLVCSKCINWWDTHDKDNSFNYFHVVNIFLKFISPIHFFLIASMKRNPRQSSEISWDAFYVPQPLLSLFKPLLIQQATFKCETKVCLLVITKEQLHVKQVECAWPAHFSHELPGWLKGSGAPHKHRWCNCWFETRNLLGTGWLTAQIDTFSAKGLINWCKNSSLGGKVRMTWRALPGSFCCSCVWAF